jgi:cAMP phosphodiesterase
VPSSVSDRGEVQHQFMSSYVINDTLAVDAGCLGFHGTPHEQARIKHVLITHTHIDHIGSLPLFVENAYEGKQDCVIVYGSDDVLDCLHKDIFNDRVWPDFFRLSTADKPFLKAVRLEPEKPLEIDGVRITPVTVNHVVPTLGFVLDEQNAAVLIVSDTGPTDRIWEYANRLPRLKAVFLEVTFPNEMAWLADVSKHLTPSLFAEELRKLHQPAAVVAVHLKARYRDQVIQEIQALGMPQVEIGRFGKPYYL